MYLAANISIDDGLLIGANVRKIADMSKSEHKEENNLDARERESERALHSGN